MTRLAAGWVALLGFAVALAMALWPLSVDVRNEASTGLQAACRTARLCDRSDGSAGSTRAATWKPDCGSMLVGGVDHKDRACSEARRDRLPMLATPLALGVIAAGLIPALPKRQRDVVPGRGYRS